MKTFSIDELNKKGLTLVENHRPEKGSGKILMTVQVELGMDADPSMNDLQFTFLTRRGIVLHLFNFHFLASEKKLSFLVGCEPHESFLKIYGKEAISDLAPVIGMEFSDFCWRLSNGTKNPEALSGTLPVRAGAVLGDLTWVLPSKFADDILDALDVLNGTVLEGLLMDAMLYGPFYS